MVGQFDPARVIDIAEMVRVHGPGDRLHLRGMPQDPRDRDRGLRQAALRLQDKVFARRARLCERVAEAGLGLAELIAGGVVEEVDLQFQGRSPH